MAIYRQRYFRMQQDEIRMDPDLPSWMDKVDVGAVGVMTLDDGECLTVEVHDFNEETDELIVEIVSANRTHVNRKRRRAIPIQRVVSFELQQRAEQPWPHSDPCRGKSSLARLVLMTTLFLGGTIGSLIVFILLMKTPYGLQETSVIGYTLFVAFSTFAHTGSRGGKDLPPFMFTCPAVRPQLSRLLRRHVGFLLVLVVLQTLALAARPHLPAWWNTETYSRTGRPGGDPFEVALFLLCFGLFWTQVLTNRSVLDRAHREFNE